MTLIVDLGYPRTGTRSLAKAFNLLGINARHGPPPKRRKDWERAMLLGKIDPIASLFDEYEFVGQVAPTFYHQIAERFPDALFVLPIREGCDWIGAARRWHYRHKTATLPDRDEEYVDAYIKQPNYRTLWKMILFGMVGFHKQTWETRYVNHTMDVQNELNEKRLLCINIWAGGAWGRITGWLKRHHIEHDPAPDREFPHVRRSTTDLTEPTKKP